MTESQGATDVAPRKDNRCRRLTADGVPPKLTARILALQEMMDPALCWPWPGVRNAGQYGDYDAGKSGGHILVHRAAYALQNGEVPAGLLVRHSCDNPPCFNWRHLLTGTVRDNSLDMVERERGRWSNRTPEERWLMSPQFHREVHPGRRAVISPDSRRWDSARLADEALGLAPGSVWYRCTFGVYGWHWEDDTDERKAEIISQIGRHGNDKPVRAPDGRTWPSAKAAGDELGHSGVNIARRCRMGRLGWSYI